MLTRKVCGKEVIDYDGTVVFSPDASGQLLEQSQSALLVLVRETTYDRCQAESRRVA
jgi:hypothetical protein